MVSVLIFQLLNLSLSSPKILVTSFMSKPPSGNSDQPGNLPRAEDTFRWPRGYKTSGSTEHEIYSAHIC